MKEEGRGGFPSFNKLEIEKIDRKKPAWWQLVLWYVIVEPIILFSHWLSTMKRRRLLAQLAESRRNMDGERSEQIAAKLNRQYGR